MNGYKIQYHGHKINQRRVVLELGLVTEAELALYNDKDVERLINDSGYIILSSGDDFALLPKEYEDKLTWIRR
ncbi:MULTISPECIES: hypothetical protein [Bacillus subtilis group]|uniref:hypothetical protein n=1 Tax=Bacillus subtilis group TaxID=653685 RepID=UPI0011A2589B|nr:MULTISPECIES: hypothetical protein [Bacillus subtilis group]MEC2335228.1 hypothetical protein [Bacillus subtilis]